MEDVSEEKKKEIEMKFLAEVEKEGLRAEAEAQGIKTDKVQ
jgi:hypothetical protein